MNEARERRLALNEALVREVNEAVQKVAAGWFQPGEPLEFRCECVNTSCAERVVLTLEEYLEVRASSVWFVVVPGHEEPEIERVVRTVNDAHVVEKTGAGRAVAEETDLR